VPTDDAVAQEYRGFLVEHGVITLPTGRWIDLVTSPRHVLRRARHRAPAQPRRAILVRALGNLLQLRSVLAVKDDIQRTARQSNDPPGRAGSGAIPSALAG
jgi:hypothetical protein